MTIGTSNVKCGRPFKLPTFEHRFTGHQAFDADAQEEVLINTCGFWAAFYSLATSMSIPLLSLDKDSSWIKMVLIELQKEYRAGGVTRDTYQQYMQEVSDQDGLLSASRLSDIQVVIYDYDRL